MINSKAIGTSVKIKISAWILMSMVLMTIVPFNLLHDHEEELALEQSVEVEDHGSCDHEFHLAEEHELCLLCHFVFIPSYELSTSLDLEAVQTRLLKLQNGDYDSQYHFLSVYSILNKGSPLA
ncbi:MAG: hypothetical protein JXQ96_06425 [Cyclobacteriaceae bacterium]